MPFITSEGALGENVSKLVSGVDVFDLNLWVKIDPVKQPIKRNSVGSGYASRRRTSAFDENLDDRYVVFKNVQQRIAAKTFCVSIDVINFGRTKIFRHASIGMCFTLQLLCDKSLRASGVVW